MRCQACNKNLSDREANRKFLNWQEIKNPEDRYLGLCERCTSEAGIDFIENPLLSDVVEQEEEFTPEEPDVD